MKFIDLDILQFLIWVKIVNLAFQSLEVKRQETTKSLQNLCYVC